MEIKKYKKIETEYTDKIICDKCKKAIEKSYCDNFECSFKIDIAFIYEAGYHHEDAGAGKSLKLDFCQDCAKEIMLYFETIGIKINMTEWDY